MVEQRRMFHFTLIVIFVPDSNRNMRVEYMYVYSLLLLEYIKRLDYLGK